MTQSESSSTSFIIPAKVWSDDGNAVAHFDAHPWFRQATQRDVHKLQECGFHLDYAADEVAQFVAARDPNVQKVFDYVDDFRRTTERDMGFECEVDEKAALRWLADRARHRSAWLNRDAVLHYEHVLHDNAGGDKTARVLIEADGSWASISVWSHDRIVHIADVTVELFEGRFVARVWNEKDLGGDPTVKVGLCAAPYTGPASGGSAAQELAGSNLDGVGPSQGDLGDQKPDQGGGKPNG